MTDTELPLHISCRDCAVSRFDAVLRSVCDDCVVSFFCGPDEQRGAPWPERAESPRRGDRSAVRGVALTHDEARTVGLFQRARLAPQLRHSRHRDMLAT